MDHRETRRGAIVGILTYIVWGLLTVYWKQLHGFSAVELIGWRVVCSSAFVAIVLSVTHRWPALIAAFRDRAVLARVGLASLMLSVNWTAYVSAVVGGRVLETALGYFIAPLTTMLVGVVVFKERLRPAQRAAAALAVAAVAVLAISYGRIPWLALAIAGSWTSYSYLKRRVPLGAIESLGAETLLLTVPAAVLVAVLAGGSSSVVHTASGRMWVLVALSGVITVIPLIGFAFAALRLPLTVLGPMQYSVPTINFLLGWLAYHEGLSGTRLIGFALVWIGLALLTIDTVRRSRASS